MPRREDPIVAGGYYHVYNRGHNRDAIFLEEANYAYFLKQFREYVAGQTSEVSKTSEVCAYVLMPNHYDFPLVPKLLFGNAPPRNSVSSPRHAHSPRSQTGVWERG